MDAETLRNLLASGFKEHVRIKVRRPNLFQVFVPFYHPDGDMLEIFIESWDKGFRVQDMGKTMMRLSYEFEMNTANKKKMLREILSNYQVLEDNSNFYLNVSTPEELYPSVMHLITVILKVSDLSYLKRETVRSLFYEYFDSFVQNQVKPKLSIAKNYAPPFDHEKNYVAPYAVLERVQKPIVIFPILNDDKCEESTIILQQYEIKGFENASVAVFENQEDISRKPLARFSDVVGKQFSSFRGNESKIEKYINEFVAA
ncbi:MAG: DUF1828 domain-containing protein [Candidatus Peribacter sp.]|jgi:hypothetical protein